MDVDNLSSQYEILKQVQKFDITQRFVAHS